MNNIRIRFTRGDDVKFISHLDLMKVFERAIRRSGMPIAYSQGFNPHPQMVFGLPLPVGVTSDGEYADFEMVKEIRPEQFMESMNGSLPEAIRITAAAEKHIKSNIMASITGADYILDMFLNEKLSYDDIAGKLDSLMKKDCIKVMKEGKGTAKEVDIRPMILDTKLEALESVPPGYEGFGTAFTVKATFRAGNTANLRPELFVRALADQTGLPVAASRMHRKALYVDKNGSMAEPLDPAVLNG